MDIYKVILISFPSKPYKTAHRSQYRPFPENSLLQRGHSFNECVTLPIFILLGSKFRRA